MEKLELLNDQMQATRTSVAKAVSGETLNVNHGTDPSPSGNVFS